jgi:hypothetical protein
MKIKRGSERVSFLRLSDADVLENTPNFQEALWVMTSLPVKRPN